MDLNGSTILDVKLRLRLRFFASTYVAIGGETYMVEKFRGYEIKCCLAAHATFNM